MCKTRKNQLLSDSNFIHFAQINEFVKRARAAKIHAYIISHLKKEMPVMMGKAKAQQRLIDNLEDEFAKVLSLSLSHAKAILCHVVGSIYSVQDRLIFTFVSRFFVFSKGPKGAPFTGWRFPECRAL